MPENVQGTVRHSFAEGERVRQGATVILATFFRLPAPPTIPINRFLQQVGTAWEEEAGGEKERSTR